MSRSRTYIGIAVLGAAGIGGALVAARSTAPFGGDHAPGAAAPRPALAVLELAGASSVVDFDWLGGEIFLLDPLSHAVIVLREDGSGAWREALRFGRYGGGPGELLRPTGIARLREPPAIAVADQSRVHLFDLDGTHTASVPLDLPCALALPRVAAAPAGIFVHGDCMLRSPAGDTLYAVLFWSRDGREYREVVREPRLTSDGRFGHGYAARSALTPGLDHHLFGTGITSCLWRIGALAETARRSCPVQARAFPLALRPETRRALARRGGPAARLPDAFGWYEERFAGSADLLLRAFSEDSLVVRRVHGERDLAVLPLNGLVGCRAGGCLYARPMTEELRLGLLPGARLDSLATP